MAEKYKTMTILLADCGSKGFQGFFKLGEVKSWSGIYRDEDDIFACTYKYKIMLELPKAMTQEEWMQWLRENKNTILKDIAEKIQKVIK